MRAVLAQIVDTLPEGIVIVGTRGRISFVNPEMTRLFGYAADELLGQPIEVLVPSDGRSVHALQREAFTSQPVTRHMGQERHLRGRRSDGSEFPVDVMLSPLSGGKTLAVVRDMSRLRDAQEALRRHELLKHSPASEAGC